MGILEVIVIILLILWIGGFALNLAGSFIHVLLVIACIMIVMRLLRRKA